MKTWQRVTGAVAIASALVAAHEGRSLVAYVDPVGIPTICEGITAGVRLGDRATPQQCDALLE
ncbi:TPA: glycoside hydrolase family protein, partial [Pseudomonas aeruginosa]